MNTPLEAGLAYAALGWRVVPLHPISNQSDGKRPRLFRWPKQASCSPTSIQSWFARWPDSGVGIVTGQDSGVFVVDVDPRHGGTDSLRRLEEQHGPLPTTVEAKTGGGGRHLFFRWPEDGQVITSTAGRLGAGLDVRGRGGFVVAAPSPHVSGVAYAWRDERSPGDLVAAPAPRWLLETLQRPTPAKPGEGKRKPTPERAAAETDRPVIDGRRNIILIRRGGALRRAGLSSAAIRAALIAENQAVCVPPLDDDEIRDIAEKSAGWLPPWISDEVEFLNDPRLDALARHVLAGLLRHTNHEGKTYVGLRTLGKELALSKNTVGDRIQRLVACGRVEIVSSTSTRTVRRLKPFSPLSLPSPTSSPNSHEDNTGGGSYVQSDGTEGAEAA